MRQSQCLAAPIHDKAHGAYLTGLEPAEEVVPLRPRDLTPVCFCRTARAWADFQGLLRFTSYLASRKNLL